MPKKMTTKEMRTTINEATKRLREHSIELCGGREGVASWKHWRHYKGGTYEIDRIEIDTTGGLRVSYHRIAGPDFNVVEEIGLHFSRPFGEWFDLLGDGGYRFVPAIEAKRWESVHEVSDRDGWDDAK